MVQAYVMKRLKAVLRGPVPRWLRPSAGLVTCLFVACVAGPASSVADEAARPPNVLLVCADDLGLGELGCQGQTRIATPHIDALAARGRRYAQAYSGAPVCAPSRCMLLTGRSSAMAQVRDNRELPGEGQQPLVAGTPNLARALRAQGYATALVGKWGLGPVGSSGDPRAQGFERFLGYACQRHAHDHTPAWLWEDERRVELAPGTYAPDLFLSRALDFVRTRGDERPFFLMYATTIPHMALEVPEDSLTEYRGRFEETPYAGGKGYTPHPTPRAAYAAMITRFDRDLGALLAELERRGELERTIVLVTSDNGATHDVGGADTAYFDSTGGLRGRKGSLHEGGLRVPLVVAGPRVAPGVSQRVVVGWDIPNTILELCGASPLAGEGLSHAVELAGGSQAPRGPIAWEFPGYGGQRAARIGDWKVVQRGLAQRRDAPIEVYDLGRDPGETRDLAGERGDVVEVAKGLWTATTPSNVDGGSR